MAKLFCIRWCGKQDEETGLDILIPFIEGFEYLLPQSIELYISEKCNLQEIQASKLRMHRGLMMYFGDLFKKAFDKGFALKVRRELREEDFLEKYCTELSDQNVGYFHIDNKNYYVYDVMLSLMRYFNINTKVFLEIEPSQTKTFYIFESSGACYAIQFIPGWDPEVVIFKEPAKGKDYDWKWIGC